MPKTFEGDVLRAKEEVRHKAQGKRHLDKDPRVECLVRRKRLTSGPHRRCLDEAIEMGKLSTEIEAREPSSLVWARVMKEARSGVSKMIDIEGHLLGPNSSIVGACRSRRGSGPTSVEGNLA